MFQILESTYAKDNCLQFVLQCGKFPYAMVL